MGICKVIENQFKLARERSWNKLYFAFDVHSTIIVPNYKLGDIPKLFYPYAKECLQNITKRGDISLILWTCSWPNEIKKYINLFTENNINFNYINDNPEVKNQGYGYYDNKFYFNVLLEDKAGFDTSEWKNIIECLDRIPPLKNK